MRVRAERRVWRGRHKTHSAPIQLDRKAVLWVSGDLDDLALIQIFYESQIEEGSDARLLRVEKRERHTRLVFKVEHSPSIRDDVLAHAVIAKLTAFTTAHGIDYLCKSENGFKVV